MILWRISNFSDLTGVGGLLYEGRWHSKGRRVVYLATNPATALLETLVHLEIDSVDDLPDDYQLLEVDIPSSTSPRLAKVPADWASSYSITQPIGDAWLAARQSLLLKVPSAVAPRTWNFLFNPAHPRAAAAKIKSASRYPYDPRLVKTIAPARR